jgi:hypothetical protein
MAALGLIITSEVLALAGIKTDLAAALLGLTWAEARDMLTAIITLSAGNEALRRGSVVSYTINGRSISSDIAQLKAALEVVRTGLSFTATGGPITMGVRL